MVSSSKPCFIEGSPWTATSPPSPCSPPPVPGGADLPGAPHAAGPAGRACRPAEKGEENGWKKNMYVYIHLYVCSCIYTFHSIHMYTV